MATLGFNKTQTPKAGRIIAWCEFRPAGTGAVTGFVGNGFSSATRTGVGVIDCVLTDRYPSLEGYSVTLMQNAAGSITAELSAEQVNNASPKVTVRTVNKSTGAAADIAAHANNRVSVVLYLKNTSGD